MSESKTPRTDAAEFQCDVCSGESWASVRADFARTLELELNEANSKLDTVLTDVNYVGGVQYWIEKYDNVMFEFIELRSQLTTAQQEIAELRKQVDADKYNREMWARIITKWNSLCTENDELKRDKERLDWLNNQPTDVEPDGDLLIWATPFTYPSAYSTGDETIRQAIDSAMKGADSK